MFSVDAFYQDETAAAKLVQVLAETFPRLPWQAVGLYWGYGKSNGNYDIMVILGL